MARNSGFCLIRWALDGLLYHHTNAEGELFMDPALQQPNPWKALIEWRCLYRIRVQYRPRILLFSKDWQK